MRGQSLDAVARKLYEYSRLPCPSWDQIGEVTRSVWRERAVMVIAGKDKLGLVIDADGEVVQGRMVGGATACKDGEAVEEQVSKGNEGTGQISLF